ncbi:MAG: hypothetical protein MRERV_3c023 [Mycoplasmataceae bacterium RV_VA103A]|nr:MAG: hypothetical protein MRERV_3c023 [Mycoplasmataceae bacterium RV_VA103A]
MPELFRLIEDKEVDKEWRWTYLCLFRLIINDREITKITITGHTWRKPGREKITKELILNIFKKRLNGKGRIKPTNYPKRKVFKRERIDYQDKKYKIIFWFENNDPNWIWVRVCHQQD